MGIFDRFKKTAKERLLEYLKSRIFDNSSLADIVNVFEKMCSIPIKDDMILFETGTYSFTGEPMFYFSLVRQFPGCEEEFYQIHVDVLYVPTEETKAFVQSTWNWDIKDSIFHHIRNSQEFEFCNGIKYSKTEIYLDET